MWPLIADLYTPLLALLVCLIAYQAQRLKPAIILLAVSLSLVFGFSALELKFGLWHSWGLDYSTHTAILLPFYQMLLVLALLPAPDKTGLQSWWMHLKEFVALIIALAGGTGYGLLMMELNYHSFGDMLTTVISTYPLVWISFHLMNPVIRERHQTEEVV